MKGTAHGHVQHFVRRLLLSGLAADHARVHPGGTALPQNLRMGRVKWAELKSAHPQKAQEGPAWCALAAPKANEAVVLQPSSFQGCRS